MRDVRVASGSQYAAALARCTTAVATSARTAVLTPEARALAADEVRAGGRPAGCEGGSGSRSVSSDRPAGSAGGGTGLPASDSGSGGSRASSGSTPPPLLGKVEVASGPRTLLGRTALLGEELAGKLG